MQFEHILPEDIEKTSFSIIEKELLERKIFLLPEHSPIIKRVIHTTADFDFAEILKFSPNVVKIIKNAILEGCDTNMALAGINKKILADFDSEAHCFMADEDVARISKETKQTRAAVSMKKASKIEKKIIFAIGNAPTALLELFSLIKSGFKPVAIIGVPVGFVNVVSAKELIMESGVPFIVSEGRKGGSTVAAAIVNAILYDLAKNP